MTFELAGILLALASFVLTFLAARLLRKWLLKRKALKAEEERKRNESRQVRRARERRNN